MKIYTFIASLYSWWQCNTPSWSLSNLMNQLSYADWSAHNLGEILWGGTCYNIRNRCFMSVFFWGLQVCIGL